MAEIEALVEPMDETDLELIAEDNAKFEMDQRRRLEARESALLKLSRLGLTDEEIEAVVR